MFSNNCFNKILNATNGGLDLIYECYPQARNVKLGNYFAIREERHPSAHIFDKDGVYLLKDFGGSGDKARDGIRVFADYHNLSVGDAIARLASRYGLEEEKYKEGPLISSVPASTKDYQEGQRSFTFNAHPTAAELAFLAPAATEETLEQLNWKSVEHIKMYSNGKEITVSSTPDYPIFVREMHDVADGAFLGYKIYQPRSKDKKFKFTYYPTGMAPGKYWHGLHELKKHCKEEKDGKVDCVVVCSGERDAIVVRSMGLHPVWGNSETTPLNRSIYNELRKCAKRIFLIPDIDETGREMGMQNMRNFPDLLVAWLPENLTRQMGDQNKPCKDLRDWAQKHSSYEEFLALLNTALPYHFWTWNKKSGKGSVSQTYLLGFLAMNGFRKLLNPITKDFEFVRVKNHIVQTVTTKDMRSFIVESVAHQPDYIRNLVLGSKCTELRRLEDLPLCEMDFANSTADSQMFFFNDKQFRVTAHGIEEMPENKKVHVREEKVSKHDVTLLPSMFSWEKVESMTEDGEPVYVIQNNESALQCKLFRYLSCASLLYWNHNTEDLTDAEQLEENRALAVKMFHIGHMLHRKRMKSKDWAPIMMDYNTPLDMDGANGGVGKSFLYQDVFPSAGYSVVKVRKQTKRPSESEFLFDQVTQDTDIVYFDECGKDFRYDDLNDTITGDMVVNKKNKSMFTIPYAQVPKMAFLTNYVPKDFDASSDRRHIYDVSSDYFHQKSPTNSYAETRTIMSEFGCALMQDDYPAEDWNRDLNLLMQIEQFYLDVSRDNVKLAPPMHNIMKRHDKSMYDDEFESWADRFYSDTYNLNRGVPLTEMMRDYQLHSRYPTPIDKKVMKKNLRAWAKVNNLEYNPLDVCNDKASRRIKFRNGTIMDEKIYLRGSYEA